MSWLECLLSLRLDARYAWLAGTECSLVVNNLFDQAPPLVNQFDLQSGNLGYDVANASLVGRQISLQIVKRWGR